MQPTIILIEPQLGENIGMVARAMLNFGLTQLRLVNPQEPWPNEKAKRSAVGADVVLDNAQVYTDFEKAIGDLTHVYATSAMRRYMVKPAVEIKDIVVGLDQTQKVGIIFGPERTGLTNDYISRCQGVIRFPTNPDFSSLNLAQSVLLCAYEWAEGKPSYGKPLSPDQTWALQEEIQFFLKDLEETLDKTHFFYPYHKQPLMWQNLSNIFTRMTLTQQEVRTLRGVLNALKREN